MKKLLRKGSLLFLAILAMMAAVFNSCSSPYSYSEPASSAESSPSPAVEAPAEDPAPPEDIKTAFATEIVAASKLTLDKYLSDYKISLAPQNWNIVDFDENGALGANAKITLPDGSKADYLIVFTPIISDGKLTGITPHYVYANGVVYGDDGYCDEYFAKLDEEDAAKETSAAERSAPPAPEIDRTSPVSSPDNNFNTYNETDRANTTAKFVLNTRTMKIHNPGCRAVPKISPDNYLETNESVEALEAKGYEKCGMKGDWYN